MKVEAHQRFIVIQVYLMFHEILFSGYLNMALDGWTDGLQDKQNDRLRQYNVPSIFDRG